MLPTLDAANIAYFSQLAKSMGRKMSKMDEMDGKGCHTALDAAFKETVADLPTRECMALMHSTLLYHRIMCVYGLKPASIGVFSSF